MPQGAGGLRHLASSWWCSDRQRVPAPADAAWAVRITPNPLVPWIWFGAAIMALGGAVSLTDRRLRVGAPTRRPRAAPG